MRPRSKQSSGSAASSPPPLSSTPTPSSSSSRNGVGGSGGMATNGHRSGPSSSSFSLSLPSRRRSLSDPFNRAMLPPVNESPAAREDRIRLEQAAKLHSDAIDEQIKRDRAALKKQKQAIKILLLGQSESGKSTTLKQFQLLHSPAAFHQERMAWRVVIYLNLIRSVRRILDALIPPPPSTSSLSNGSTTTAYIPTTAPLSPSHSQTFSSSNRYAEHDYDYDTLDNDTLDTFAYDSTLAGYTTSYSFTSGGSSSRSYANGSSNSRSSPGPSSAAGGGESSSLQARFERYAKQLAPLFALELRLMRQLSFPDEDDDPVTTIPDYAAEYVSAPTPTPFSPSATSSSTVSPFSASSSPPRSGPKMSSSKSPSSPSQPWWWNDSSATSPPALTHLTIPPSSFGGVMSGTGMGEGLAGSATLPLPLAPPSHTSSSSSSSNTSVSPISPHPYQTASSPTLRSTASTSFTSSSIMASSSSKTPPMPIPAYNNNNNGSTSIMTSSTPTPVPISPTTLPLAPSGEFTLHTGRDWRKTFSLLNKADRRAPKSVHTGELAGWWEDPADPVHILHFCAYAEHGMIALWRDRDVRRVLEKKRVRMEESSGFYLNEIERIAGKVYIPQDDDILRARLKTLGVVEHTFTIKGSERSPEWKVYDVGGARSQRQAWAPYFEDVNAIIFLAPISAFDQTLAEDSRINRLEDSMLLWRAVVSNKLLTAVSIILFLNKIDLLRAKLEAGVMLNYHMPSYGQRSNDYDSVSQYFKHKFKALHTHHTPNPERELWIHLTSVTDKQKTHIIIANVRDLILRENLQSSRLI